MREPKQAAGSGVLGWSKRACALSALCAATAIALPAQSFNSLHSFDGADGAAPYAGLVQATDGNLYGTTYEGGANNSCSPQYTGCGTIFKITPTGALTTIYNFCSQPNCADGYSPAAGVIQASDGNLYGTTFGGGTTRGGTVFRITPSGTLTTLYNFCSQSNCADGLSPLAGLLQASDGNLYGTAPYGGDASCSVLFFGCGTVFKMTLSGTLTTIYTFCSQLDCTDGANPAAGLIQATDGSLYGTTEFGGVNTNGCEGLPGCGTVFKITPSGALTTLYSFCSQNECTDGALPVAGLVQATSGNFYGTTKEGGTNTTCSYPGCGTVFKMTPRGALTTLAKFNGLHASGPAAALLLATDGNLYGTTSTGQAGVIFKTPPTGGLTLVFGFDGPDGAFPEAALIQDTNGTFFGTTSTGGANNTCNGGGCGTVFSLSVGLGPFVETQPTSGKVGAAVKILGTGLTGATAVTFNGVAATFRVVSRSVISTTVPQGATTGNVQVTTPGGTLTSNVPFRVKP